MGNALQEITINTLTEREKATQDHQNTTEQNKREREEKKTYGNNPQIRKWQ